MPESAVTLSTEWETARELVDQHLDQYSQMQVGCPPRLADAVRYSLLAPGKRIRPLLVLLSCRACGGTYQQAIAPACAVEMIHAYSLIHDDLPAMDDDDTRRGQPACHIRFDEATAILAGDALLARAFEILAQVEPPETAVWCVRALAAAAGATRLVGGQVDDLSRRDDGSTLEQLEYIHRRKTGALLTVSLQLGGIVSRGDHDKIVALAQFGEQLGLAFQIVDDLLDIDGDPSKLGKRTGQDQHHNKLTYPALLGVEPSRQRARLLIDSAIDALNLFGADAEPLRALARFVIDREQ